jgi:hypothetical protein
MISHVSIVKVNEDNTERRPNNPPKFGVSHVRGFSPPVIL